MSSLSLDSISQIDFSQMVSDSTKWVFENNQNLLETTIPLITFIGGRNIGNISILFSGLLAGCSFIAVRFYYHAQKQMEAKLVNEKKEREAKSAEIKKQMVSEKIQLLISYLFLNFEQMNKIFQGYEENEKKEKLKEVEYAEKKKAFLGACETLGLSHEAVQNIWAKYPIEHQESLRDRMLINLIPHQMKQYLIEELQLDPSPRKS